METSFDVEGDDRHPYYAVLDREQQHVLAFFRERDEAYAYVWKRTEPERYLITRACVMARTCDTET